MDKEQLNAKLKEKIIKAGDALKKENVKQKIEKAKNGVGKAVDVTVNSEMVKQMSAGQKLAALGVGVFVLVVLAALVGRFMFTPPPSVWCVAEAPSSELSFGSAGVVAEVAHAEKQVVSKGDTMARLQDEAFAAASESAEAKSTEANFKLLRMEHRLADLETSLAESKLKAAESANTAAAAALGLAQAYEKQYRSFLDSGTATEADYDASVKAAASAEAESKAAADALTAAQQAVEAAKKGYSPEEIAAAKQEATAATDAAAKAKTALEGTLVTAPFNAYINKVSVAVGDSAEPGKAVFNVSDLSKISLRGLVNKSTAGSIKAGSVVKAEFSEITGESFSGKVAAVASESTEQKDGEDMYEVRIELDNPSGSVLPGLEAVAVVTE